VTLKTRLLGGNSLRYDFSHLISKNTFLYFFLKKIKTQKKYIFFKNTKNMLLWGTNVIFQKRKKKSNFRITQCASRHDETHHGTMGNLL
jgi:hypothetical protein